MSKQQVYWYYYAWWVGVSTIGLSIGLAIAAVTMNSLQLTLATILVFVIGLALCVRAYVKWFEG